MTAFRDTRQEFNEKRFKVRAFLFKSVDLLELKELIKKALLEKPPV
jgi:hypothetical protein